MYTLKICIQNVIIIVHVAQERGKLFLSIWKQQITDYCIFSLGILIDIYISIVLITFV